MGERRRRSDLPDFFFALVQLIAGLPAEPSIGSHQELVDMALRVDARHDFLAEVASFLKIQGAFHPAFLGKIVFFDILLQQRQPVLDPENLECSHPDGTKIQIVQHFFPLRPSGTEAHSRRRGG